MNNSQALITVFTPTYNRERCLIKCYKSLCKQTSYSFEWLIIDDGSTDGTEALVTDWQASQHDFSIRYYKKENGGLHTGYNAGIELAQTELFVCIDSDDWMPDDAIARIEADWRACKDDGYIGIMGLDRYEDGSCVGDPFPENVHEMYLYEKLTKYRIAGDKKLVHRTDLLKKVAPMPSFDGEKNFNPSYMMYQLDKFGKLFVTNECFCIVEYQPNGMSSNIYKQYRNSPNSFAETRKLYLSFPNISLSFKLRQHIHYVSSCILAKKFWNGIKESPSPLLSILCIIPGCALAGIIIWKTRK